jgi:DNA-binding LacI/PurR family transcriptional regulator
VPEHERRSTSADVARVAGVARSTVSYVLNNHPHQKISEATRQRVLAAAEQLGYRPSAAARALRERPSRVVGVHAAGGFDGAGPDQLTRRDRRLLSGTR